MKNQHYAYLKGFERINNSSNGNPNYRVMLELANGDFITMRSSSDSSWCYGLGHSWIGKAIVYTETKSNRINYMKVIELKDIFAHPILNERKG